MRRLIWTMAMGCALVAPGAGADAGRTVQPYRPEAVQAAFAPHHDYTKTLVGKLFLSQALYDGPFKRRDNGRQTVKMTCEQALEAIRGMDNITLGMPKVMYLVGWQYNGHDSKYPAFFEGNPAVKRAGDADALASVRWLMAEGRKHHTTVSLHVNMFDAYEDSPLFARYKERDVLARDAQGAIIESEWGCKISYAREWETGLAKERLDRLLEILPIAEMGTLHIDAFHSRAPIGYLDDKGRRRIRFENVISPYHRLTQRQEIAAQVAEIKYLASRGVDVTSEFLPGRDFAGLMPMVWHYSDAHHFQYPHAILCGGNNNSRWGEVFGNNLNTEAVFVQHGVTPAGFRAFTEGFCLHTARFNYLNRLTPVETSQGKDYVAVTFKEGVVSELERGRYRLTDNGRLLADGNDEVLPALWTPQPTLIAFSKGGYAARTWNLGPDWSTCPRVRLSTLDEQGRHARGTEVLAQGCLTLSLKPGEMVVIEPEGNVK